jgi:hypothetical protein
MRQDRRLVRMSWLSRLMRGLRPDRNPLRRATDWAEAALVAGLLAVFLAGTPVVAITAGRLAAAAGMRSEQAARYRVRAVLLQNVPDPYYSPYGVVAIPALARWTAPDGSSRTGLVNANSGGRAGTTVIIWTSESGRPLGPPLRDGQLSTQVALAAMAAPIALGLVLLIAGMLAIGALNRRRLAAWESDWRVTAPKWTSRK